ncbi:hypothetical protein BOTBODRAFT_183274 [Botryobasidium botryosum FD-172 SS1]|uniref:F-box domain-containing protein n=1 Tax=Botryobasidium botryosum (strain FD-172 SS1) TaxID=930990 RepID=A0A067N9N7_BOTB1|nr:hypothetical protein BOTBODRAFT_183274 [Botryobasidium botryosum FD-172 SS1]
METREAAQAQIQAATRDIVAQMLQQLYLKVYEHRKATAMDVDVDSNPIKELDEECEIISLVRDFVVDAATKSYTIPKLSALRSRRNRLSPAGRLPSEITSLIFKFAKGMEPGWMPMESKVPFNVVQVSKSWREAAMGTFSLWTEINNLMTGRLIPAFIENSGIAPLDIRLAPVGDRPAPPGLPADLQAEVRAHYARSRQAYYKYRNKVDGFMSPLAPHTSRWRTLHIQGVTQKQLEKHLLSPAPLLESLALVYGRAELDETFINTELHPKVVETLFAGETPRLSQLTLHRFYQPFDSPIYTGLSKLDLRNISVPFESIPKMLTRLGGCPGLQYLSLAHLKFYSDDWAETSNFVLPTALSFPHLDTLTLHFVEGDAICYIFASCHFPSSIEFSIRIADHWIEGFDRISLPDFVPTVSLPGLLAPSLRILAFSGEEPSSSIRCEFESLGGENDPLNIPPSHIDFFSRQDTSMYMEMLLTQLSQTIPVGALQKLNITCGQQFLQEGTACVESLRGMPALTSLELDYIPASVLEALIVGSAAPLCPSLRELAIKRSEITREKLVELASSRAGSGDTSANVPANAVARLRVLKLEEIFSIPYSSDSFRVTEQYLRDLGIDVEWREGGGRYVVGPRPAELGDYEMPTWEPSVVSEP